MENNEKYITALVTGFGPFNNHIINASWEAVKELNELCANSKEMNGIKVIVKEIPVSYEDVTMHIPKLWEEYKPTVVLHVGVSHKAQCLTIESCAHNNGYLKLDVCDKCPDENNIEPKILETKINVRKVAPEKTLFVHVPDFDQYSSLQSARGLYDILRCIIKDMKENEH
ncbi:Pyroglutamyl-peptidase 1 [Habropoda laboriosa]|uniref:Pyroglutamyl-peptidase 1 n=1 Tax=Habropoda laboriosa TaxID=597456 RepID=A0A0L7RB59_9HYME|nr:Pyroglutamyl-peptidase 1 [Habropoda laboriosa]